SKLHSRANWTFDHSACHPDGSRDADGECVCCRRYFLGSTSGDRCCRDSRLNGVTVDLDLCTSDRTKYRSDSNDSPAHRRAEPGWRCPRGCTSNRDRAFCLIEHRGHRCPTRAETPDNHGRLSVGYRTWIVIHSRDAGRKRHGRYAVYGERNFPGCRWCGDCYANALASECDQYCAGPLFDLWTWTVPETWNRGGSNRNQHRARYWSTLCPEQIVQIRWPIRHRATSLATRTFNNGATDSLVCYRNIPGIYWHGELDWTGSDHFQFW